MHASPRIVVVGADAVGCYYGARDAVVVSMQNGVDNPQRGANALGVPAPVNRTLHALVKLLEMKTVKP